MKQIFLSALLAVAGIFSVSTTASAQTVMESLPPYKFGFVAGLNASSFSDNQFDGKFGFHVGVNALFDASELLKNTYLRTELLVQRKGARYENGGLEVKYRNFYLELPIHYGYALALNSDWTLFGETGPYLAVGIGGRVRSEWDGVKDSEKFFSYKDANGDDPNNFDFGWGVHVGGMFQQKHELKIGWDWGFIDMKKNEVSQNRNFMVSYCYYIR